MIVINKHRKLKLILLTAAYALLIGRKRRYWVHPLNQQRARYGEYKVLCLELEKYPEKYFTYFRMSQNQFDALLQKIEPDIVSGKTKYRIPIEPKLKLVLTLR